MNSRQKFAIDLMIKEERISEWESRGITDKDYCVLPNTMYVEEWNL